MQLALNVFLFFVHVDSRYHHLVLCVVEHVTTYHPHDIFMHYSLMGCPCQAVCSKPLVCPEGSISRYGH